MPNERSSVPCEIASGSRLIFSATKHDVGLTEAIVTWLSIHAPGAHCTIAELANPARSGGAATLAVAIEGLDPEHLDSIRLDLAQLGQWDIVHGSGGLLFGSR